MRLKGTARSFLLPLMAGTEGEKVAGWTAVRFGDVAARVALESEPRRVFRLVFRVTPLDSGFLSDFVFLVGLLDTLESESESLLDEESSLLFASSISSSEEELSLSLSLEEELLASFAFLTLAAGVGVESFVFLVFGSSSEEEDTEDESESESDSEELEDELEEEAGALRFNDFEGVGASTSLASESESSSEELETSLELEPEELESDGGALRFKLLVTSGVEFWTFLDLIFLTSFSLASESVSELELDEALVLSLAFVVFALFCFF
jgi:hypothetical protein